MSISSSQIETKWIFLVVGVFTSLLQCRPGVENLNKLIMIYKNWPSNAWLDYKLVDGDKLAEFFVAQDTLKENEDLLENVGYLEEIKF